MSKSTLGNNLPRRAERNLQIVGEQIRLARLRRDLSIAQIAERASCSELTVMRVEKGTPTVAIGIYLRVLFALGLDESKPQRWLLVYTCASCLRWDWMRVFYSLPKMTRWDVRCRIWI